MASVAVAVASRDVGGRSTVTTAVPGAHTLGPSRRQRAVVWRTHSVRKPWVAMHAAIESAHTRRQRIAAGAEPAYSNVASDAATSGPNRAGCFRMRRAWRANCGPKGRAHDFARRLFTRERTCEGDVPSGAFSSGQRRFRFGGGPREPQACHHAIPDRRAREELPDGGHKRTAGRRDRHRAWRPGGLAARRLLSGACDSLLPSSGSCSRPAAPSAARASGIRHLRPATARRFGLVVDAERDDRADPAQATRAAARYLGYLHRRYRDWPLALAAYNAGEGRIDRALARQPHATFWELSASGHLPRKSRDYVPRFLALVRLDERVRACAPRPATDQP